jgi:hypothetical protein
MGKLVPLFRREGGRFRLGDADPAAGDHWVEVKPTFVMADQRELTRLVAVQQREIEARKQIAARNQGKPEAEQARLPDFTADFYDADVSITALYCTGRTSLTEHPETGEALPRPNEPGFWEYFDDGVRAALSRFFWQQLNERAGGSVQDFTKPASGTSDQAPASPKAPTPLTRKSKSG